MSAGTVTLSAQRINTAESQTNDGATGVIRGTVVDTRGTPVQRVSVRLQSSGRSVITDEQGRFEIASVPAGVHELYISAVDYMLVRRSVTVAADAAADITISLAEGTSTYTETVTVRGDPMPRREPAVAAAQTLGSKELQQLRGVLTNDPFRAVQVLPAVAATDDLRSEFAIRGAGIRQMNFTFEGIATPFLLHTVQQVHDSGSVAMVSSDVLEEISLLSGSYPQRFGNRTGAEIDFRMREGSRERSHTHVSVSAIDASGVTEGPIGHDKRGSWLFSARKSYLDLVVSHLYPDQNISFGFADIQAKLAYDVTPAQQVQVALTAGRSRMERKPDQLGPGNLRDAENQAALAVTTWRYFPSPRFTMTQRLAAAGSTFNNNSRDGADLDSGSGREIIYRGDLTLTPSKRWRHVTVEGGAEARWSTDSGREQRLANGRFQSRENYDGSAVATSAYVQTRIARSARWSLTPGIRVDRSTLTGRTSGSPWMQAMVPLSSSLTVRAGGGIYRQEPGFGELLGTRGSATLRAERAYHADAGVEGRIGATGRWQMTIYNREDRDLLRLPNVEMRVANGVLLPASITSRYANALSGRARGVEWLMQRQTANGFSGWASYALTTVRYHDQTSGETFWGDYDQRHTVNLYGNYRLSDRLSLGARFRAGSNFPLTGYWAARDDRYLVGTHRNTARVPGYSRLDARVNRAFTWDRKRLTLFVEGLNLMNRPNARQSQPSVDRRTLEATGMFDTMVPLMPSIGILLEF